MIGERLILAVAIVAISAAAVVGPVALTANPETRVSDLAPLTSPRPQPRPEIRP